MLWILADVAAALTLVRIWRSKTAGAATASSQRDYLIALVYVLESSMYSDGTVICLTHTHSQLVWRDPQQPLTTWPSFVPLPVHAEVRSTPSDCCLRSGAAIESMIFLSIATNTSIYPALLLLPLLLVIRKRSGATTTHLCGLALLFVASEAALVSTTQALYGSQSLKRSWGLM